MAFIGLATAAGLYLNAEFEAIRFSRKCLPLFVLKIVLILYVVYGNHVPGLLSHPGLPRQLRRHSATAALVPAW